MTMKTPLKALPLIAAGAVLAVTAGAASASGVSPADHQRGEARLAQLLEGRTPGQPVSCINTMRSDQLETIDGTALVYHGGKTIWVARPVDPDMLGRNDAIVMNRFDGARLCVQESMRTIDRYDHHFTGVVMLKDFVPYTKAG
jgi:hypothetical protein